MRKVIANLPVPVNPDLVINLTTNGVDTVLKYSFTKHSKRYVGRLEFNNTIKIKFNDVYNSPIDFIGLGSNNLVEVVDSIWVKKTLDKLAALVSPAYMKMYKFVHYGIFLEDNGTLEVIADSVKIVDLYEGEL